MHKTILIILILAAPAYAYVDDDHDGYGDDEDTNLFDMCLGTPEGSIVDRYGCSCMQKTLADCSGEWCCQQNPDPCIDDCAEDNFSAVCTFETQLNYCGQYRDCPDDGCFSTQLSFWIDYPQDGHDYCENGICMQHTCEPTNLLSGELCDYQYCNKRYGEGYWCGDYAEFRMQCGSTGTLMQESNCNRNSNSPGICISCASTCTDTDEGSIFIRGTVTFAINQMYDTCQEDLLVEWECDGIGSANSKTVNCADYQRMCMDGACVPLPTGDHGQMCDETGSCSTDLECMQTIAGIERCCNAGECPSYEGCIQEGGIATILGREYICRKAELIDKEAAESLWCSITTDCQGTAVLALSDFGHASLPGQNPDFSHTLCCQSTSHTLTTSGNTIMSLSDPAEDAHVSFVQSQFPNKVMLGMDIGFVQCTISNDCATDETCMLSIYEPLNDAHVAACDKEGLQKLCCRYTETNDDTTPPVAQAEYDGTGIRVLTNEHASCLVQSTETEIPCTDESCTEHYLEGKIGGVELISCKDSLENQMKMPAKVAACEDGTPYNQCSTERPNYCDDGWLEDMCDICGCTAEKPYCIEGKCKTTSCLQLPPAMWYGPDWENYCLNDPVVRETAEKAVQEYAEYTKVQAAEVDTADEYMEAVGHYVAKNMEWMEDPKVQGSVDPFGIITFDDTEFIYSACETIKTSGSRGCGKKYCGDCEDHALLRTALLRSLGVHPNCVYTASDYYYEKESILFVEWDALRGHVYNIVNYEDSYRIMDYDELGHYFYERSSDHETDGIWNDYVGKFGTNGLQGLTWNYPSTNGCRQEGWTEDTYYMDICP
ncbi:MAG: hypothetical protein ABIF10_00345 [Candidatus Woesearchaeota archaeon]